MSGPPPVLDVKGVAFRWPGHSNFKLSVPDFKLAPGETVLLLGDSGSGKSTLLSLICGTLAPDTGQVEVAGIDMAALSSGKRDRWRAEKIGVIFQQFNLLPFATVVDNILLPLRFAPQRRVTAGNARAAAETLCHQLGLPADVSHSHAGALSVGQQQRVAVARALIGAPPLIIADEPTSALDANSQDAFLSVLFGQVAAQQTSLLMVSHDARLGERFDRVVQMSDIAQVERRAA